MSATRVTTIRIWANDTAVFLPKDFSARLPDGMSAEGRSELMDAILKAPAGLTLIRPGVCVQIIPGEPPVPLFGFGPPWGCAS